MRILYFISVVGNGIGGHYHSLDVISKGISQNAQVGIISIGPIEGKSIQKNPSFLGHIYFNGKNFIALNNHLKRVLKTFAPDIIHCFDTHAYNVVKLFVGSKKYRFVLNKCGGPNPIKHPSVEHLILFSNENYGWFKQRKQFANTTMHLIPNRVSKIVLDTNASTITKDGTCFCFVQIARIGSAYKKSISDAINLIDELSKRGITNVKLYMIGTVEDWNIYNELVAKSKNLNIEFLTEEQHTVKASRLLYLADAVIGAGRSIMEATSLGLPTLTPASNSSLPVLVTENNFDVFLRTNFSERNTDPEKDREKNLLQIIKLITEKHFYGQCSNFSATVFKNYFDVEEGIRKYNEVYKMVLTQNRNVPFYYDLVRKAGTFRRFYRRNKEQAVNAKA